MKKIIIALMVFVTTCGVLTAANERPPKKSQQERFAEIDTDGDNVVSESEWIAFHKIKFAEMDKDEDGSLSQQELRPPRPPR